MGDLAEGIGGFFGTIVGWIIGFAIMFGILFLLRGGFNSSQLAITDVIHEDKLNGFQLTYTSSWQKYLPLKPIMLC